MQLVEVYYKGKRYAAQFPENWQELDRGTLLKLCSFFDGRTLSAAARYKLCYHLLGLSFGKVERNKALLAIPHEQLHFLSEKLQWIFEPSTLTKSLIKTIRVGLRTYYGPNDFMNYATFDEVVSAYVYQNLFKQATTPEKKLQHLAELAAVLYRPRKWWWPLVKLFPDMHDGDCRLPINEATIKPRAKQLMKAKPEYLYAALLFFEGCHAGFEQIAPDVFSSKGVGEGKKSRFGWETFYVGMAGEKFGTIHEVGKTYWTSMLLELQHRLTSKPNK